MKCPGQDPRYWTGDVVSDVPCPHCGQSVEFFRDESSARCPRCGNRFRNPNLDLACAQWCAYAEQCLGYAPERSAAATTARGPQDALAGRLIRAAKEAFERDPNRLAHSLLVFQHARELLSKEGGDPRVVLAAGLLLEGEKGDRSNLCKAPFGPSRPIGPVPFFHAGSAAGETPRLVEILRGAGLDEQTVGRVAAILDALRQRGDLDTPEFAVVCDADLLARLTARRDRFDRLPDQLERQLKTPAGRQRARAMFSPGGHAGGL